MKELDVVRLKDGREGTILDFYDDGKVFMMEITDKKGRTLDTPFINVEEVEEVIYTSSYHSLNY